MQDTVLFVDDSDFTLGVVKGLFSPFGEFRLITSNSAAEALKIFQHEEIAVVVSDNIMPAMGGIEFLGCLTKISPHTVKILMSAHADLESALAAINNSEVYRYILKPFKDEELIATVRDGVKRYQLSIPIQGQDEDMLRSFANSLEIRDPSTKEHCDRIAVYAQLIAERYGMSRSLQREIRYGAWLHDCGKIGISELILNGPGTPGNDRYETMKSYSILAADVAAKAHLSKITQNIIRYHHEHYDGTGYPDGLKGEAIPIEARIVAVADVFDVLISEHPYRKGFSRDEAIRFVTSMSGEVLDPQLVLIFMEILKERTDFPLTKHPD